MSDPQISCPMWLEAALSLRSAKWCKRENPKKTSGASVSDIRFKNPLASRTQGWCEPREVTFLGVPFLRLEARNSRKYRTFDSFERECFDASSMRRQDAGDQNPSW
jgi:hypothetical protein